MFSMQNISVCTYFNYSEEKYLLSLWLAWDLYPIHQNTANDEERVAFLKNESLSIHCIYCRYLFIFPLIVHVEKEHLCSLAPQRCNHLTQWDNTFDKYK